MRYDAFISYNHGADGGIAPYLQDALQRITKPWYRRRAMEVFRDYTDLPPSANLSESIEAALDNSRYYVLLASPGGRGSRWVGEEIDHWLATKTAARARMLLVLTDGALVTSGPRGTIDYEASSALHESMRGRVVDVPFWIDLTAARQKIDAGTLSPRRFRREHHHEMALLAATIKELPVRAVEDADARQQRRALRLAWSAVAMLVLLAVASIAGLVVARRNADRADRSAADARAHLRTAESESLAASALTQDRILGQRTDARLLAALANRVEVTPASTDALFSLYSPQAETKLLVSGAGEGAPLELPGDTPAVARVSQDGRVAVIAQPPSDQLLFVDARSGHVIATLRTGAPNTLVAALAVSTNRRIAAQLVNGQVLTWASPEGQARVVTPPNGAGNGIALSPDGRHLAYVNGTGGGSGRLSIVSFDRPQQGGTTAMLADLPDRATDVAFGAGTTAVMIRGAHTIQFYRAATGHAIGRPRRPPIEGATIDPGVVLLPGPQLTVVAAYTTLSDKDVWSSNAAGTIRDVAMLTAAPLVARDIGSTLSDAAVLEQLRQGSIRFAASGDGRRLAALVEIPAYPNTEVLLLDPTTSQSIGSLLQAGVQSYATGFTPRGGRLVGVGAPATPSDVGPVYPSVWSLDLTPAHALAGLCASLADTKLRDPLGALGVTSTAVIRPCPREALTVTPHRDLEPGDRVTIAGRANVALEHRTVAVALCTRGSSAFCETPHWVNTGRDGRFRFRTDVPAGYRDPLGGVHDCTVERCDYRVVFRSDFASSERPAVRITFAPGAGPYVPPSTTSPGDGGAVVLANPNSVQP
jgi:hypothetical protein